MSLHLSLLIGFGEKKQISRKKIDLQIERERRRRRRAELLFLVRRTENAKLATNAQGSAEDFRFLIVYIFY